jgi:hypothetical protein
MNGKSRGLRQTRRRDLFGSHTCGASFANLRNGTESRAIDFRFWRFFDVRRDATFWKRSEGERMWLARTRNGLMTMLLKKSIFSNGQNFPEALVRSSENYMGGHMSSPISNRQAP